jgi:hypothetical protein
MSEKGQMFRLLEGQVNDLRSMAEIAFKEAMDGEDDNRAMFALTKLYEMVAEFEDSYYTALSGRDPTRWLPLAR